MMELLYVQTQHLVLIQTLQILSEHFTPNTRDLTLTRSYTLIFESVPRITIRGDSTKHGYAMVGPRMKSLSLNDIDPAFTSMFGGNHPNIQTSGFTASGSGTTRLVQPMTLENWANHRLIGTQTNNDGEVVQIDELANRDLKTYITYPTEIKVTIPGQTFDQTDDTFDTTGITFDDTTL